MDVARARRTLLKSARLRLPSETSDFDAMAAVAHDVIQQMASGHDRRVDRVLSKTEECLVEGDGEVVNLIWIGLIEDLGNISSHDDIHVTPRMVRDRLGPKSTAAWDELDAFWSRVAPQKPSLDPEGNGLTIEQYESVESPALRSLLQEAHRKTQDGTLVGVADVLRFEARTGESVGRRR